LSLSRTSDFFKKSFVVARYTFIEVVKSRVLTNVFLLGFGLMLISFVASEFTYGVPKRVALDFGMGTVSLSAVGIAIFMGVSLLSKEIENRTIYMVLSRPLSRASFLFGRIWGMMSVLKLNIFILSIMTISLYLYLGGNLDPLILWCVLFTIVEAAIILMAVVLFSLITNTTMSVIYSLVVYIVGHALNDTMATSLVERNSALAGFLKGVAYIFPNFSKLNVKDYLIYEQNLPFELLGGNLLYGICYFYFLLFLAMILFNRKSLD